MVRLTAALICLTAARLFLPAAAEAQRAPERAAFARGALNPILPGYFADPSIVRHDGEWFIYATIDPWGGNTLGLWRSRDFRNWTFAQPNWPTKAAASSASSNDSRVWAPSVIKANGRFWMYVSVGGEVWVGTAAHPTGPWRDANGGKPLIPGNYRPGYHMIDAEAFVDDDGQAYLYWGSGLNWVNGRCFAVKLKPDMVTFDGEPIDVTPPHYFEAPFMVKRNGRYFLTYSWGNTTKDTYQVRYAVGDSPLGPFREPTEEPLLATDQARDVISPGHHSVFRAGGKDFILYHRQSLPFVLGGEVLRQVAVDELRIGGDRLQTVVPTHRGPQIPGAAVRRSAGTAPLGATLTASSAVSGHHARAAGDDNYATSWRATGLARLTADLGSVALVRRVRLRPGLPATPLPLSLEASQDGRRWQTIARSASRSGSPIDLTVGRRTRYVRVTLPRGGEIIELEVSR